MTTARVGDGLGEDGRLDDAKGEALDGRRHGGHVDRLDDRVDVVLALGQASDRLEELVHRMEFHQASRVGANDGQRDAEERDAPFVEKEVPEPKGRLVRRRFGQQT